jgi:hypothetical protein
MKLNTFWGLKGHGEKGSCKFGEARSWSSGEMGSMSVYFPSYGEMEVKKQQKPGNLKGFKIN